MFKSIRPVSAFDLLRQSESDETQLITTLSDGFDGILGGGVSIGKLTEVCGAAGLGKTQLCMQLCVNVQIPERFGGLGAKAIYIDTEGSFVSSRLVEIANATMRLLQNKFNLETKNGFVSISNYYVEVNFLFRLLFDIRTGGK